MKTVVKELKNVNANQSGLFVKEKEEETFQFNDSITAQEINNAASVHSVLI
jgi:hypothetical protein